MGNNLNGANFSFYPFYFQEKIFKSIMNPLWAAQKKTRVNILCPVKRNWGWNFLLPSNSVKKLTCVYLFSPISLNLPLWPPKLPLPLPPTPKNIFLGNEKILNLPNFIYLITMKIIACSQYCMPHANPWAHKYSSISRIIWCMVILAIAIPFSFLFLLHYFPRVR